MVCQGSSGCGLVRQASMPWAAQTHANPSTARKHRYLCALPLSFMLHRLPRTWVQSPIALCCGNDSVFVAPVIQAGRRCPESSQLQCDTVIIDVSVASRYYIGSEMQPTALSCGAAGDSTQADVLTWPGCGLQCRCPATCSGGLACRRSARRPRSGAPAAAERPRTARTAAPASPASPTTRAACAACASQRDHAGIERGSAQKPPLRGVPRMPLSKPPGLPQAAQGLERTLSIQPEASAELVSAMSITSDGLCAT